MPALSSNKHTWFALLALSVLLLFLCFRPLNAPAYRIIAADGLGYYSYLPARFIYHDTELQFHWFDTVFNRHYDNHLFETPTDNFMVQFGSRRINKYYPGQSLLQLPFFLLAHGAAKAFHYPADGFSFPYQLAMGLAALFYALLGLFFCHRLLLRLFNNSRIAIGVTAMVFFGTNLFTYTIYSGCYSHVYSFCMLTLTFYSAHSFFNRPGQRWRSALLTLLFAVIVLTIRPLNLLLLAGVFYFYKPVSRGALLSERVGKFSLLLLLLLTGVAGAYSLDCLYRQTGGFFTNSYATPGNRFYFDRWDHVADSFVGFQHGMLWYAPLLLLSLAAIFLIKREPRLLFLCVPLLGLTLLYSFWWYWNIVPRVLVDATPLVAILLGHVLVAAPAPRAYRLVFTLALLCVPLFQLKAYQLRSGILDSNYTYFKYYAKHFFTLHPVNVFPVNPRTVVQEETHFHDFEQESGAQVSEQEGFESKKAAQLNSQTDYAATQHYTVPAFFSGQGFKKIKVSFWIRASEDIGNIHLAFAFARNDSSLLYRAFYMKDENLRKGRWELKEFGMDLPPQVKPGDKLSVYFWNPDHRNAALIDNLKVEFLLTDGSDELTTS